MDYTDTQMMIRNASQVRRIAGEMNRLNNVNLLDAAENVSAIWCGDAASAFLQHCAATREQIRSTVGELNRVADDIELRARSLGRN